MAEITEKRIRIAVDGVEKELANLNKVDAIAAEITKEFQRQGRVIDKQVNAQIQKMARELANSRTQVKGLRAQFRGLFKEVISAGGASGGISGLFGGIIGGFTGGLFAGAVEDGIMSLYEWVTAASEATDETKELESATQDLQAAYAEEAVQLESLFQPLMDTNTETSVRKELIKQIQEEYGDYIGNIDLETASQIELEGAYIKVKKAIIDKITVQAKQNALQKTFTTIIEAELKLQEILKRNDETIAKGQAEINDRWSIRTTLIAEQNKKISEAKQEFNNLSAAIDEASASLLNLDLDIDASGLTNTTKTAKDLAADAAKASKKRLEGLKVMLEDVNAAREYYIKTTADAASTEKDIADARAALDYYQAVEEAALSGAGAVGSLTGKTEEALKRLKGVLSKEANDSRKLIKNILSNVFDLSDESAAIVYDNLGNIADGSRDVFDVFAEVLETTGEVVFDTSVKAASGGLTFIEVVNQQLIPGVNKLSAAESELAVVNEDLANSQASTVKNAASLVDIQGKYNDAIAQGEDNIIARQKAAQESLFNTLSESPELLLQALNKAANTDVKKIFEATTRAINEGLESTLRDLNKEADDLAAKYNIVGRIIAGDAVSDENFTVVRENYNKLSRVEQDAVDQIVKDLNERRKLAFKANREDLRKAEVTALENALANLKKDNELEIRALRAALSKKKTSYDSYYDDVLESNERFAERMRKKNGELSDDDINFIRNQKEEQIKLLQEQLDLELQIETDQALALLANEELSAEARETIFQEFLNTQTKIINKYQDNLKKVDSDFERIIEDKPKTAEEKFKKILNDIVRVAQQAAVLINNIFTLVEQRQQAVIDALQDNLDKVEDQLSQAQSNINELEDDLEGKRSGRREAVLRAIAQEQEREERLAAKKLELSKKIREEEIKLAKQRKAAAITQAIINGALAITNIWATVPKADWGVTTGILTGISAAITATEIALIASQKFARGGHTGSGGERDETGHRVAGVVHDNEWVAPKWMVQSPTYSGVIQELENARTRGFADGGFTTPDFGGLVTAASPAGQQQLAKMIQNSVEASLRLADRPIIAKATEFTNVSAKSARRINATTIGG